jgi:hypothetical protein
MSDARGDEAVKDAAYPIRADFAFARGHAATHETYARRRVEVPGVGRIKIDGRPSRRRNRNLSAPAVKRIGICRMHNTPVAAHSHREA